MKIIYFTKETWEEEYIKKAFPDDTVVCYEQPLQEVITTDVFQKEAVDAEVLCVFVHSSVGEVELAQFPKLRLVATRSTGFDHVDVEAARAGGFGSDSAGLRGGDGC